MTPIPLAPFEAESFDASVAMVLGRGITEQIFRVNYIYIYTNDPWEITKIT